MKLLSSFASSTFFFSAVAALAMTSLLGSPAQAREGNRAPAVINGIANPPLAGAALALRTKADFFCTGSLWRPRIIATAAHCLEDADGAMVDAEDISVWAPGANSSGAPSPVRVSDIIVDDTWFSMADDDYEAFSRDLAFLILDQPLGSPVWTRMATPTEVAALTWNSARVEFVGYGNTSPSVDPNASLATTPGGVNSRLYPGYESDLGLFDVEGNERTGTCGGDSGGPWMSRVGREILYLGPLSGGQGLPCDKPQPEGETYDWGPVASANKDLVSVALATAGEAATPLPRTCIKGADIRRTCWDGRAWVYDYCWSAPKAELWKWAGGNKWNRVDRYTAVKEESCGKRYPYRIVFRELETKRNALYEVYLPKQRGLDEEQFDAFRVTVS